MDKAKQVSGIEKILAKIALGLKNLGAETEPPVTNAMLSIKGGGSAYHTGDPAVGINVFSDMEMTTALADGTIELEDGVKVVIVDGVITEIIPVAANNATPEEFQAKEKELEEAKAREAALQNRIVELEATNKANTDKLKAEEVKVENAKKDLLELKNMLQDDKGGSGDKNKETNQPAKTRAQIILERAEKIQTESQI